MSELKQRELTPREIVAALDKHIVGQGDAKRAVAIAMRNRWRRRQLPEEMRDEISPKNILMIGPTGVGKTEIARRLAKLTNAPFVKVEATKYTEVGYYGRDVESMIRELVENAIGLIRASEREKVQDEAEKRVEDRILDILVPLSRREQGPVARLSSGPKREAPGEERTVRLPGMPFISNLTPEEFQDILKQTGEELQKSEDAKNGNLFGLFQNVEKLIQELADQKVAQRRDDADDEDTGALKLKFNDEDEDDDEDDEDEELFAEGQQASEEARRLSEKLRESLRHQLRAGKLDDRMIPVPVRKKAPNPFMMMSVTGSDSMDTEMSNVLDRIMPSKTVRQEMTVADARKFLLETECDALISEEKVTAAATEMAENTGIIFLDEIDKIVASEQSHGADVSRQGVQRDLLPIVEGTTIQTRYGYVKTDHILFIAAGAFHKNKPSDLMPELQGRFPIRVELQDLSKDDFKRILHEPKNSLLQQYEALLGTEGVKIVFEEEAIDELAAYAWRVNQTSQNIGARRLYTILERLLEELSFEATEIGNAAVPINVAYVRQRLEDITQDEDLSRFIL